MPIITTRSFFKDNTHLVSGGTLGSGNFGKVVEAIAYDIQGVKGSTKVAVKMLKETAHPSQQKDFIGEIKIMMHIGQHLNVVNLLGAVTKHSLKGQYTVPWRNLISAFPVQWNKYSTHPSHRIIGINGALVELSVTFR